MDEAEMRGVGGDLFTRTGDCSNVVTVWGFQETEQLNSSSVKTSRRPNIQVFLRRGSLYVRGLLYSGLARAKDAK
ncbi:hypothetical protein KIN20_036153 [Parelaphostrongylus tenuis]|uniref:Uncharacterized protein n=1 Tax=Parelaphostrongylus tenuis TaxID=148309 RepID=A0AAD5RC90_PARTN|nr:hypothetical protein KIN20_036153 [Parelaphostrongylus tenuis]